MSSSWMSVLKMDSPGPGDQNLDDSRVRFKRAVDELCGRPPSGAACTEMSRNKIVHGGFGDAANARKAAKELRADTLPVWRKKILDIVAEASDSSLEPIFDQIINQLKEAKKQNFKSGKTVTVLRLLFAAIRGWIHVQYKRNLLSSECLGMMFVNVEAATAPDFRRLFEKKGNTTNTITTTSRSIGKALGDLGLFAGRRYEHGDVVGKALRGDRPFETRCSLLSIAARKGDVKTVKDLLRVENDAAKIMHAQDHALKNNPELEEALVEALKALDSPSSSLSPKKRKNNTLVGGGGGEEEREAQQQLVVEALKPPSPLPFPP
eukprot:CAMPEP_0181309124 /NCGR_PEP_ID=MMETSP1101-20121128/11846_1 /TAXON_ID=46948 /ORGANISM="Rhodomonas abbreviata, Strain Caron Lab Isolate" /LENGTH=320 /DNA_ID=CAMNT_0023415587 /DNA_START=268 /DNA_END=1226 /DNA_ORIENTATION=+